MKYKFSPSWICVIYIQIILVGLSARPSFTEVSASAGIDYIQYGASGAAPLPAGDQQPYMSGGAATGDFDGDGWVDLYVTRQDAAGILYRNSGDGTFSDVTNAAFGASYMRGVRSNGAAWGDIDNDGDLDLYVTTFKYARHLLFINNGQGKFTEEGVARGADVPDVNSYDRYGFSSTFGDYDGDGYLDMHVTEWRLTNQLPGDELETQFHRHNTRLLHNLGAANPGYFEDVTDAAGVAVEQVPSNGDELTNSEAFASRFSDIDRDGHPDLLIASDHKTSRLFWNNGDGTFTDGTETAGVGTDRNGMGSALGDYDGDGDLDWFITSIYQEGWEERTGEFEYLARNGNRLFSYDGDRTFSDVTDAAGVRNGQWGWGAAFIDYDNDGDLDLSMTNGIDFESRYADDKSVFWENNGTGSFANVSDAVAFNDTLSGKGLLTFDYDQDGDLDIFIANNSDGPLLYRNDGGNESNWMRIELMGTRSNAQALGAFVTVTPDLSKPSELMVHEMNAGSNYLGQSETTLHFGLGNMTEVDEVKIEWPDGATTYHSDLEINATHEIEQPGVIVLSRFIAAEQALSHREPFSLQLETSLPATGFVAENLPVGLSIDSNGLLSGMPTEWGHFSVTVTLQHADGNSQVTLEFTVLTTYESWAAEIFAEAGESAAGPNVDFDEDGRSNFQEYVDQTNPKAVDSGLPLSVSILSIEGREYLSITYREFRYAKDLLYKIGENWNLLLWFYNRSNIVEYDRKELSNGIDEVRVYSDSFLGGPGGFFMRVLVEKTNE